MQKYCTALKATIKTVYFHYLLGCVWAKTLVVRHANLFAPLLDKKYWLTTSAAQANDLQQISKDKPSWRAYCTDLEYCKFSTSHMESEASQL